jgi:diguanylate cyclase (GGDEF)-like protein
VVEQRSEIGDPATPRRQPDSGVLLALGVIVAAGAGTVALVSTMPGAAWVTVVAVTLSAIGLGGGVAAFVATGIVRPLRATTVAERRARAEIDAELRTLASVDDVLRRLDTALTMADTEAAALGALGRAVDALAPRHDHHLLLASADEPDHVRWSVPLGADGTGIAEQLDSAAACGALVSGHRVAVASTSEIDTCPHLRDHPAAVSGACVPVRVGEGHLGSVCSTGAPGEALTPRLSEAIERAARATGTRIAAVRAASVPSSTEVLADPLTGLPNHTALRAEIRSLIGSLTPFSLALCDIDGFADYNAEHGTDQGDRALRLVARTLGATLRPGDKCSRFGGDVFAVVFPRCSTMHAQSAMERFRESLVLGLAESGQPHLTWSAGVADSSQGASIDELVESAEIALIVAKHEGGNRVRTATFETAAHPSVTTDLDARVDPADRDPEGPRSDQGGHASGTTRPRTDCRRG